VNPDFAAHIFYIPDLADDSQNRNTAAATAAKGSWLMGWYDAAGTLVLAMVCFTLINQGAGFDQGARWQSAPDEKKAEMWSAPVKPVPVGPMWNSWELTPSMATKAGVTLPPALHFVHVPKTGGSSFGLVLKRYIGAHWIERVYSANDFQPCFPLAGPATPCAA
jgi:hypothetical protein